MRESPALVYHDTKRVMEENLSTSHGCMQRRSGNRRRQSCMAAACKTLLGSTTLIVLFGFCLQVYFLTSQEVYNRSKHNNSQRLEEGEKGTLP